jgi:hypothetical protein
LLNIKQNFRFVLLGASSLSQVIFAADNIPIVLKKQLAAGDEAIHAPTGWL